MLPQQDGFADVYKRQVQTDGNPLTHTILRGAVDKYGKTIPNDHYEDLYRLYEMYQERNLLNPACVVDANPVSYTHLIPG